MLSPGGQAEPAELEFALRAGHVHAALVLLNRPLALGAGLGVCQDPVQIFALCTVLDYPLPHGLAVHLQVRAFHVDTQTCHAEASESVLIFWHLHVH